MGVRSFYRTITLWLALVSACYGQNWHPMTEVKQQATNFLSTSIQQRFPDYKTTVSVNSIDQRLRLSKCDNPLTYTLHEQSLRASNVTVKAQCMGVRPWSFYLTAKVTHEGTVLVANRDLARHETLSSVDVRLETRKISSMSGNNLSQITSALGLQTKKALRAGEIIRSTSLTAAQVVSKGDHVTITAISQGISVAAAGTAMNHGKVGEQIRVQNDRTERIIKAKVVAAGQVEIHL